jgi:hypothetical protein
VAWYQQTVYILYGNRNANHHSETGFLVHKGILSAVGQTSLAIGCHTRIVLRDGWCYTALNAHAPDVDKSDDIKAGYVASMRHVKRIQNIGR